MTPVLDILAKKLRHNFIVAGSFVAEQVRRATLPAMKELKFNDIDVYICRSYDENKEQRRTKYFEISKLGDAKNVNVIICENTSARRLANESDVNATAVAISVTVEKHAVVDVEYAVSAFFLAFLADAEHCLCPISSKVCV